MLLSSLVHGLVVGMTLSGVRASSLGYVGGEHWAPDGIAIVIRHRTHRDSAET